MSLFPPSSFHFLHSSSSLLFPFFFFKSPIRFSFPSFMSQFSLPLLVLPVSLIFFLFPSLLPFSFVSSSLSLLPPFLFLYLPPHFFLFPTYCDPVSPSLSLFPSHHLLIPFLLPHFHFYFFPLFVAFLLFFTLFLPYSLSFPPSPDPYLSPPSLFFYSSLCPSTLCSLFLFVHVEKMKPHCGER